MLYSIYHYNIDIKIIYYSPVADPSLVVTCTVTSVDDGLLRTILSCAGPPSSLTLYVDSLNITVMARGLIKYMLIMHSKLLSIDTLFIN